MVHDPIDRYLANAPQGHRAFAVLGRLLGVGLRERALGRFKRTEVLDDVLLGLGLIKLAGDDEDDVVRLIIFLVKLVQASIGTNSMSLRLPIVDLP